jgi:hypothetical protein
MGTLGRVSKERSYGVLVISSASAMDGPCLDRALRGLAATLAGPQGSQGSQDPQEDARRLIWALGNVYARCAAAARQHGEAWAGAAEAVAALVAEARHPGDHGAQARKGVIVFYKFGCVEAGVPVDVMFSRCPAGLGLVESLAACLPQAPAEGDGPGPRPLLELLFGPAWVGASPHFAADQEAGDAAYAACLEGVLALVSRCAPEPRAGALAAVLDAAARRPLLPRALAVDVWGELWARGASRADVASWLLSVLVPRVGSGAAGLGAAACLARALSASSGLHARMAFDALCAAGPASVHAVAPMAPRAAAEYFAAPPRLPAPAGMARCRELLLAAGSQGRLSDADCAALAGMGAYMETVAALALAAPQAWREFARRLCAESCVPRLLGEVPRLAAGWASLASAAPPLETPRALRCLSHLSGCAITWPHVARRSVRAAAALGCSNAANLQDPDVQACLRGVLKAGLLSADPATKLSSLEAFHALAKGSNLSVDALVPPEAKADVIAFLTAGQAPPQPPTAEALAVLASPFTPPQPPPPTQQQQQQQPPPHPSSREEAIDLIRRGLDLIAPSERRAILSSLIEKF